MNKFLIALFLFLPLQTPLASDQGVISVVLTIVAPPTPPKISEVRISQDRLLVVHEW